MTETAALIPANDVDALPARLDPEAVALVAVELDRQADADADNALAPRTRSEYAKDWATFLRFTETMGWASLPADVDTIRRFVAASFAHGHKVSTVRRRCSAINHFHKAAGLGKPASDPVVQQVITGRVRTEAERAEAAETAVVAEADPIMRDHLVAMLPPLSSDRLVDIRDRALLLVGFNGFMRRSELAALTVGNMRRIDSDCIRFHLPRTKTGPRDPEICRGSSTLACPVDALDRWLAVAELNRGPVFRSVIGRNGSKVRAGKMAPQSIDRIIRGRALSADLPAGNYSGHSLRRGAATQAHDDGHAPLDIARAGGWKDGSPVLNRYIRSGERRGLALL